ncbi:retrovirus-related pol polyprotein from transposon TNT 1-94 [Tanacetum coccineum]
MNYVPVTAGTISNESVGTQGKLNAGTSKDISQDCIMMPIWKDVSYFDSPAKDVDNGEPKTAADAQKMLILLDNMLILSVLKEKLLQFKLQQVSSRKRAIGTKWVFKNKKDKRGIVIRNKARLVAQGHRQEEGIDYEEVFALVARIKAIRLFLAYASFMGFLVYQMYVKSAFLYGTIEKEVYVTQPPGFKDPDNRDKVYKVAKALYGLHQAPRVCQDKYVAEILKKFNYSDVKSALTPVDLEKHLVKDGDANDVDVHLYRSMIGSLMYPTTSRPDIMFVVCTCARFQVTLKTSYLLAVKRIFRYLKGKPTLGLWYSRDYPFKLVAYTDNDYAGATQDRKSTYGELMFEKEDNSLGSQCLTFIHGLCINMDPYEFPHVYLVFSWCVVRNRVIKTRLDISKEVGTPRYLSLVVPLTKVGDEAIHKELGDRMERAATTASSLEAEQDSGDIK